MRKIKSTPFERRQDDVVKDQYGEDNYHFLVEGKWLGSISAAAAAVLTEGAAGPVVEQIMMEAGDDTAAKALDFITTHPGKQFKVGTYDENVSFETTLGERVDMTTLTMTYIVAY
jgi:hypothetical protein